ncbi:hypothetical protein GH5_07288 [Leishmania sp. Ghana 2012 LV757]|uniref:hypothetical protein n=1 Tax=Leishmania sp. Ghana 2012 LV757 TaxID=2803181 RepID=UPI001B4CC34E|nr:hypothetical protein GH5_07288 [Leishmania sp. Ghana 2012 LV757]
MKWASTALGSVAQNVAYAPSGDGGAHSPDRSVSEAAQQMQHMPAHSPLVEEKATEASAIASAVPSSPPQDPTLVILPTPTPPLTAQGLLAARRPVPHVSLMLAGEVAGVGAAAVLKAAADTVGRPIASPSRAVRMGSCVPAQRPSTSPRARKAQKRPSFVAPRPVLLRNPYGMERPRLVDPLHSSSHAHQQETLSSHVDAEALLLRRDAALYDACATRLRAIRQERRALATKLEASKQQLERVQALLDVRHEKPEQPLAAAQTKQPGNEGDVPESRSGSAPRKQETERMMRQLRALDRVNDELRQRYEALEREKKRCLTVHHARLRRPALAAALSLATSRRPSTSVACDESKACARSTTLVRAAQALETRLVAAMAQQQTLRQELALAMAKERGRIKAFADLQARGFAAVHAPFTSGGLITSDLREAAA